MNQRFGRFCTSPDDLSPLSKDVFFIHLYIHAVNYVFIISGKGRYTIAYSFQQCLYICLKISIAPDTDIGLSITDFDTCSPGITIDDGVILIELPLVACVEITIHDDFSISVELIDSLVFLSFPPSI